MKCLLCGSEDQKVFEKVTSFDFPLVYYQCQRCGLIFQEVEESPAAQIDFYASKFRQIYQDREEPTEKDIWVQMQRAINLLDLLHSQKRFAPQRILDIGASAGVFLSLCRESFTAEVAGVEPGDAYRAYAEARGLRMFASLERLMATQPEKYDLVSLLHVLEHLTDPLTTLRMIGRTLISEEGMLLLEVPNFYAHDSYELAHMSCFTPHTLRELVKQAGFRIMMMKQYGKPRSMLLDLYIMVLACPMQGSADIPPVRPDRYVRHKRMIGLFYRRVVQKLFPHLAWLPLPGEEVY